jgi:hypothetical protein
MMSIQSTCSAFFKPVVVRGEKMLAAPLGPNTGLNPEDILMEKDEEKSL